MFNKDDLKQFFENAKTSRREFFDYISKMSIAAMASSLNLSLSEEGQAASAGDLFDFTSLMNTGCLFCWPLGMCIVDGVPFPYIIYKVPIGFAETGDAGQFGASSDELAFLSYNYALLKKDLLPFSRSIMPPGIMPGISPGTRYGEVGNGQTTMQLYPHYYGLSPTMISQIQKEMIKVNTNNKACLPCLPIILAEDIASQVTQVQLPPVVSSVAQMYMTQLLKDTATGRLALDFFGEPLLATKVAENLAYINARFPQITSNFHYAYTASQIPSVPSELFSFIWAIQELSPDAEKWKYIMTAIQAALGPASLVATTCPYLAKLVLKIPALVEALLMAGFDPNFLCVGLWGEGYPRVGEVEVQDPIVGGLLTIARWHNLISTRMGLVITPPEAAWYQVYNPYILGVGRKCFRPGYVFSEATTNEMDNLTLPEDGFIITAMQPNDPSIAKMAAYYADPLLVIANFALGDMSEIIKLVLEGSPGSGLSPWQSIEGLAEDMNPFNKRNRNVGVVVWQQYARCCFKSGGGGFGL